MYIYIYSGDAFVRFRETVDFEKGLKRDREQAVILKKSASSSIHLVN